MKLKEFRKKLKISQTELSNKIQMPQSTYSHYENGSNEPDIKTLIKLADFYKVPIDALVERKFNNIEFAKFTDTHFELLSKIAELDEGQCKILLGYLDGMKNR